MLLGLALGEWRRLPLVGALGRFELSLETIAFGLETSIALLQFGYSPLTLRAAKADRSVHTVSVAKPTACSCATFVQVQKYRPRWALHKYRNCAGGHNEHGGEACLSLANPSCSAWERGVLPFLVFANFFWATFV